MAKSRFNLRLGNSLRDQRIAEEITRLVGQGVNVSEIIKNLLYTHFTGLQLTPAMTAATPIFPSTQSRPGSDLAPSSGLDMSRSRKAGRPATIAAKPSKPVISISMEEAGRRTLQSIMAFGADVHPQTRG